MAVGSAEGVALVNWWVRNTSLATLGATVTIGLHSGDPGSAGTASEFSSAGGFNYARGTATFASATYSGGTSTATATASVAWAACPAGTIASITVFAGGTYLIAGALTGGNQAITGGNNFSLATLSVGLA